MKKTHREEMSAESKQPIPPWVDAICNDLDQVIRDNIGHVQEKVERLEKKVDKATSLYETLVKEAHAQADGNLI